MFDQKRIYEEFLNELVALRTQYGLTQEEFAGALVGAGVQAAKDCGLNKGQIIATVSKAYTGGPANDH